MHFFLFNKIDPKFDPRKGIFVSVVLSLDVCSFVSDTKLYYSLCPVRLCLNTINN